MLISTFNPLKYDSQNWIQFPKKGSLKREDIPRFHLPFSYIYYASSFQSDSYYSVSAPLLHFYRPLSLCYLSHVL